MAGRLPAHEFQQIVRLTPLVSIDLVIWSRGKLLVGRRKNEPAKNQFFVPGGRILKDETIAHAFSRLVQEELGFEKSVSEAHFLGVFDHIYSTNAFETPGFGTHYVVLGYEFSIESEKRDLPNSQHSEYQWMTRDEVLVHPEVHPLTKGYLNVSLHASK